MPLIRYPILQHAYVVNDIDAAMREWTETTGAGPFWLSRNHYGQQHTYRGQPWDEPLHYAFAGTGPTHVQLIQQDSATPSVYRDMYAPGEEGFHHVAVLVPEAEHAAEVERFRQAGLRGRVDAVVLRERRLRRLPRGHRLLRRAARREPDDLRPVRAVPPLARGVGRRHRTRAGALDHVVGSLTRGFARPALRASIWRTSS